MQVLIFSKHLQEYNVAQMGDIVAQMGFEGIDLTVRPGGHILPERVKEELPGAIDILKSKGLSVPMITTNITNIEEGYAKDIYKVAANCGVKFLKLGYWRYEGFGKIKEQIKKVKKQLKSIESLSQDYGICSAIHIHSGDVLSADAFIVYHLLEGFHSEALGAYIDPAHMVIEGGKSGWKIGMDLLSDYICLVAIKDFGWFPKGRKKWEIKWIPLSEGMVPWQEVFTYLKSINYNGYLSFHSEYKNMSIDKLIEQTKQDLAYIQQFIK